ncbi:MAG: RNA polymerase sigma factor [Acidimicrobiales bacterium]
MATERERRFDALYQSTSGRIAAYALRRAASRDEAADVVAETFTVAWRRLDDVPEGEAALLWLYVTARQVLANRWRSRRRHQVLVARLADQLAAGQRAVAPPNEEAMVALACLRSLPDDQREVLLLTAWEGLSGVELGRVLGCSPTAARIRLHRARTGLRKEMARFAAGDGGKRPALGGHGMGDGAARDRAVEEA